MCRNKIIIKLTLILLGILPCKTLLAQVQIKGTIYDRTQHNPLEGVSVLSTSGIGAVTDSFGNYSLKLPFSDSIYFSYLNKPTMKFAVKDIQYTWQFDMALQVRTDMLPTVFVRPKNYRQDSIENRREYAKIFNYHKINPLNTINTGDNGAVGIDPNSIIDMLNAKKQRRMAALQKRLEEEEENKYIDHRFTKNIVKKLTGLQAPALDTFMRVYRPSYEFAQQRNDLELYQYIWEAGKYFAALWKREHGG